jgi:hypothetical protein
VVFQLLQSHSVAALQQLEAGLDQKKYFFSLSSQLTIADNLNALCNVHDTQPKLHSDCGVHSALTVLHRRFQPLSDCQVR